MNKEFRATLPEKFVKNTISLCGEKGEKWLDELSEVITKLETQWSIIAEGHFRNLSYNYVANARLHSGEAVVLKIGLPLEDVEIFGEAAYLQAADGQATVKIYDFDRDKQAILIERVTPGHNLTSVCKKDQADAVRIAIQVLRRLLKPAPSGENNFINLDCWFNGLKRAIGGVFPQDYARKALDYYAELSTDTRNIYLLHGDLHHYNILQAKREPFLAIDPKGMIGHVGYDIGVFLNNHHDWLEWNTRLEGKLDKAVADFASVFELDEAVVRKWAYCQMVLSWWWMFDEMPDMFGGELGLSDIWKV